MPDHVAMVVSRSSSDHPTTVGRLVAAIEQRGLTVFARFDHAAAARDAGLELGEELVVVFGNPQSGTPLMQSDPRVGIELPLRILVWDSPDGVRLGYNDPRELGGEYELGDHGEILERMAGLLQQLVAEAAG
jgi:uncharacterized protein (DUF302 family)